jgi:putative tricarboxylic transport membrane protein
MQDRARNTGDLWSGLALAALAIYIMVQAFQWEYVTSDGPGPGFFPMWYGIAMLALAAVLVFSQLRRRTAVGAAIDRKPLGRALSTWLALAASVALFKPLGFYVSFALLTGFIVAVMYRRPAKIAALVALASSGGFFLVFQLALGVALPVGVLGF